MKKIITTMLVVIVLFNFIFCNHVYADEAASDSSDVSAVSEDNFTAEDAMGMVYDGVAGGVTMQWDILGAIFGTIAGIIALAVNVFPMLIQAMMTMVTSGLTTKLFTIEQTVFNEFSIFNVNYFNFNSGNSMIDSLRGSIAKYFYILRLIAIAASLLVLIYVGIRMALSTIAADKAKYKSMLISWVESMVVLFLMQYIISFMLNLGEIFNEIVRNMRDSARGTSFETETMDTIYSLMIGNSGWTYVLYSVVFWFLVFIQSKFFMSYFKRLITVGFLILIAPLVTITYSIDKIGDGKAQAFTVWFTELSMNIFIQPIHAIIYLVFMYTAGEIAKHSILVALIFLLALTKVEKMILYLFNLKNVVSLRPVEDERKKKV